MSRIGKKIINIPEKVKVTKESQVIKIEGPAGKMSHNMRIEMDYTIENKQIKVSIRPEAMDIKKVDALHGLERALINNKITGVNNVYSRRLLLSGVGYRAALAGKIINFTLGFSHPVTFNIPEGVTVVVEAQTKILLTGVDKDLVGLTAQKIKNLKWPEPYQGKGITYEGERIRRKAGKSAASGAKK
ncbi:MAG: 50S ribosomal protein L6 [bacterium]